MDIVQLLETGMLVCFGFSWPVNIAKSYTSRTAKGKSVMFEYIVCVGYICGITGKFVQYVQDGRLAFSTWFYILDILLVLVDIVLYHRNVRLDRIRELEGE